LVVGQPASVSKPPISPRACRLAILSLIGLSSGGLTTIDTRPPSNKWQYQLQDRFQYINLYTLRHN
jgi:hypothetical protein